MNKKVNQFFMEYNLMPNSGAYYGELEGFLLSVVYKNKRIEVFISCFIPEPIKENLIKQMNVPFEFQYAGLSFSITDKEIDRLLFTFDEKISAVVGLLKSLGVLGVGYCSHCGKVVKKNYKATHKKLQLCEDCLKQVEEELVEENFELDNLPKNYTRGLIGAIMGGFIGVVIAILLHLLGNLMALSILISIGIGSYLYLKLGGKKDKGMIMIVGGVTFFMLMITFIMLYLIIAQLRFANTGFPVSMFKAFSICMGDITFFKPFFMEIGIAILFYSIGICYLFYDVFKRKNNLEELT